MIMMVVVMVMMMMVLTMMKIKMVVDMLTGHDGNQDTGCCATSADDGHPHHDDGDR